MGQLIIRSNEHRLQAINFAKEQTDDNYINSKKIPILQQTFNWLDTYFSGKKPAFTPAFSTNFLTPFRQLVIEELLKVPYGELITYGEIANRVAQKLGKKSMSAQAVGGAVGWNPICLIIPCHRVIGKSGDLTGYREGIDKKIKLLIHEGHTVNREKMKVVMHGED